MVKIMFGLKNKDLTELQKEFIKAKKDRMKKHVKTVAKVVIKILLFALGTILSYLIGNYFFTDFVNKMGFWGYLCVFLCLLSAFFVLDAIYAISMEFIYKIRINNKNNKIEFAVRGFLTNDEYRMYKDYAYYYRYDNISNFYNYSTDSPYSADEEFDKRFNKLQTLISILEKLKANSITVEQLKEINKNQLADQLENCENIKEMFTELTECKNNKQYNFHCEDYKVVAD